MLLDPCFPIAPSPSVVGFSLIQSLPVPPFPEKKAQAAAEVEKRELYGWLEWGRRSGFHWFLNQLLTSPLFLANAPDPKSFAGIWAIISLLLSFLHSQFRIQLSLVCKVHSYSSQLPNFCWYEFNVYFIYLVGLLFFQSLFYLFIYSTNIYEPVLCARHCLAFLKHHFYNGILDGSEHIYVYSILHFYLEVKNLFLSLIN